MKQRIIIVSIVWSMCYAVLPMAFADGDHTASAGAVCGADGHCSVKDEYDSINWVDIKRKEHEEEENWYSKFKAVLFRERTKKSLTGDDVTIVETLEVGEGKAGDDNSVSIIKIKN